MNIHKKNTPSTKKTNEGPVQAVSITDSTAKEREYIAFQQKWQKVITDLQSRCLLTPPQLEDAIFTPENVSTYIVELTSFHKRWGHPVLWLCCLPFLIALFFINCFLQPFFLLFASQWRLFRSRWNENPRFIPSFIIRHLLAQIGQIPILWGYNLFWFLVTDLPVLLSRRAFWRAPKSIIFMKHPLIHQQGRAVFLFDLYQFMSKPKYLLWALIIIHIVFMSCFYFWIVFNLPTSYLKFLIYLFFLSGPACVTIYGEFIRKVHKKQEP